MKRVLALVLLISSVGITYGGYYRGLDLTKTQKPTTQTNKASSDLALAKAEKVDISKIDPKYADSAKQLKEAVITIIKSAKVLAPALLELGKKTASGGLTGLVSGAVSLVSDSDVRNSAKDLVETVIATIGTAKTLAQADPSSKKTIQELLGALTADPDIANILNLVKAVPVVGSELHAKLMELITLKI